MEDFESCFCIHELVIIMSVFVAQKHIFSYVIRTTQLKKKMCLIQTMCYVASVGKHPTLDDLRVTGPCSLDTKYMCVLYMSLTRAIVALLKLLSIIALTAPPVPR